MIDQCLNILSDTVLAISFLRSSRGLVSENFVRIDMNRRRFYRPKGGIGSAAKRFSRWAWKRKFKAKFGKTKTSCFQCGQDGHWASKCPQRIEQRVEGESDAEWDGTEIMDLPTSPLRPPDYDLSPSTESVEPVYSETCHGKILVEISTLRHLEKTWTHSTVLFKILGHSHFLLLTLVRKFDEHQ